MSAARSMKIYLYIPNHQLTSSDAVSHFASALLGYTFYNKQPIKTTISRRKITNILNICTKHVHFSFNNIIYTQPDDVVMEFSFGLIIGNIFMTKLKQKLMLRWNSMQPWVRYMGDTFTTIDTQHPWLFSSKHKTYTWTRKQWILFISGCCNFSRRWSLETQVSRKPTHNDT